MTSEPKMRPTTVDVKAFIEAKGFSEKRLRQTYQLMRVLEEETGCLPVMWGASIIGFGQYTYTYSSGRSGIAPLAAFSPTPRHLTLYVMPGEQREDVLAQLGPHRVSKACIYLSNLDKNDVTIIQKLVASSIDYIRKNHCTN